MEVIQSYTITTLLLALRDRLGGWERRRLLGLPLMLLLWNRLGVIVREMERLAARFAAGLPMRRAPRVGVGVGETVVAARAKPAAARIWPYRFCWLIRACGFEAAAFMGGWSSCSRSRR